MENDCQALNRIVTSKECALAQKQLPGHFCGGCDWFSGAVKESRAKMRERVKRSSSTYIVRVSQKLKVIIAKEAEKRNVQPARYIAQILAEKLFK